MIYYLVKLRINGLYVDGFSTSPQAAKDRAVAFYEEQIGRRIKLCEVLDVIPVNIPPYWKRSSSPSAISSSCGVTVERSGSGRR